MFDVPAVTVNQPDPVPLGVRIVNVVAVDPDAAGYLTVYGCADETDPVPAVSSMNYRAGDVLAHQTFVRMEPGEQMCVCTFADTDLVVDPVGALPASDHPTNWNAQDPTAGAPMPRTTR